MVTYLLDIHENIILSKTLSKYLEQPNSIEKTTMVFLDLRKNMHVIFVGYLGNNQ